MKRLIILASILMVAGAQALSGAAQIRVESLYDAYRKRYLSPLSTEKQLEVLTKTQTALSAYKNTPTLKTLARESIAYLEHLFCHTQSLLSGYSCTDDYRSFGPLTSNIKKTPLSTLRKLLTEEHSRRRIERGLSELKESSILDSIAQNYALELCKEGEITHTLNGSTLEMRLKNGNYAYTWGGENLGQGQDNIMELLDQLTTSIYHRENMYQEEFREIGIGQCDMIWVLNYGAQ